MRVIDGLWRAALGDGNTQRLARLKHGGMRVPCDLAETLHRQFYFFGTYFVAQDVLECWAREARRAAVIFDVGANAGIFSLAALAVRPDAIVHAFEPTPEIAAGLVHTAALNRLARLHVHDVAVSSENGHASLRRYRGEFGANEGMNYITLAPAAGAELVPTVSLDQFCATHAIGRIDLLKIDIQGQEHLALAGARELLTSGRVGMIFTELNWAMSGAGGCPARESIRMLENAGYQFSSPGRRLRWQKAGDWMVGLSDVVARRVPAGETS